MTYRSTMSGSTMSGSATFGGLLRSEWTKLRSVRRWALAMGAVVVLTVLVALLSAVGSSRVHSGGGGQEGLRRAMVDSSVQDGGEFARRTLAGEGSVVARVVEQDDSHEWAKAGLMVRASDGHGDSYVALVLTPGHGVRLLAKDAEEIAGRGGGAPRWLRLDRDGPVVTGFESADGADWRRVGSVEVDDLPEQVLVGLYTGSASEIVVQRQFGGESVDSRLTAGRASFDEVRVSGRGADTWTTRDGRESDVDGVVTLTGAGDLGPDLMAEDVTNMTLAGILVGLIAMVAVAVLFVTTEYRRGLVLLTFSASPRRGRVLAAKALVLGAAALVTGVVAGLAAYLVTTPIQESKGIPVRSLGDPEVLRAVLGTGPLLAVIAVFSLAVATLFRRTTPTVSVVLLLLLVPQVVATGLPVSVAGWLDRLTPAAGFALQQTMVRYDTAIGPWAGFAVLCGYAAVALALAGWRLRRRDA
jgi:ABC-type transport system involved in multi-copper enzyme maturation permease subunit